MSCCKAHFVVFSPNIKQNNTEYLYSQTKYKKKNLFTCIYILKVWNIYGSRNLNVGFPQDVNYKKYQQWKKHGVSI